MGREKKRKDYAFRRQFNEKPSIIPGWPALSRYCIREKWIDYKAEVIAAHGRTIDENMQATSGVNAHNQV